MKPRPEHEVAYQELAALAGRHAANVSSLELLAIAANMVGKMVALQDANTISAKYAMQIVLANIEQGNKEVLTLLGAPAGSA